MLFFVGEVFNRLIRGVKAGFGVGFPGPGAYFQPGQQNGAVVDGQVFIDHSGEIDVRDAPGAIAVRAHAPGAFKLGHSLLAVVDTHRALRAYRWHVERIRARSTDVRLGDARKEHAQHAGDIGNGPEGGTSIGCEWLLANDDRRGEPFEVLDVGAGERLHKALHKPGVGFIDQPLGFRSDGVKDQRGLAGTGHTGKHRQLTLRDVDADVFQVIVARTDNANIFLSNHFSYFTFTFARRSQNAPCGCRARVR